MNRRDFGFWGSGLDADAFARALAALGVLQAAGLPGLTPPDAGNRLRSIIEGAQSTSHPILRWELPADPSTLPADQAPALADAWSQVFDSAATGFRLEVAFDWRRARSSPAWLIEQLSRPAVGLASVHIEAGHTDGLERTEWTWPLNVGLLPGAPSRRLGTALVESSVAGGFAEISEIGPDHEVCDLLLLPFSLRESLAQLLKTPVRASCVLILGRADEPWERARPMLETIESHTRSSGIGLVHVSEANRVDWFGALIRALSQDAGLDIALRRATIDTTPLLIAEQRLLERTRMTEMAATIGRRLSDAGMQFRSFRRHMAEMTGAEPPRMVEAMLPDASPEEALRSMPFEEEPAAAETVAAASRMVGAQPPPPRTPRFLQGRVEDMRNPDAPEWLETVFRAHTPHHIVVRIGPEDLSWTEADVVFPDEELPESDEPHRLRVVFTDLRLEREPQVGEIRLPREGASTEVRFALLTGAPGERIEARIVVLHRNRVLQTVLLRGAVVADPAEAGDVEPIEMMTEVVARARLDDLASRTRFDAAMILNHTDDGLSRITRIADERVEISAPIDLDRAVSAVQALLESLIEEPVEKLALESKRLTELLVNLARHGCTFYTAIVQDQVGDAFATAERIQVVSAVADAYLPIEFVYDQVAPVKGAKLCKSGREALARKLNPGRSRDDTEPEDSVLPPACRKHAGDRDIVCPLGFWGLTKVIERHVHSVERASEVRRDFTLLREPTAGRKALGPVGNVTFAASAKVDAFRQGITAEVVANLRASTDAEVSEAKTWKKWVSDIKKLSPSLLVLLPHTLSDGGIATMEVGKRAQLGAVDIAAEHISASPDAQPVALLLGCNTGDPLLAFQRFPAAFSRNGAAIVLATLTKVLGRHAAPVADRLVRELVAQSRQEETTFGDVMLAMRRTLLLEGYPMVLALTAYGDADWRFGTRN